MLLREFLQQYSSSTTILPYGNTHRMATPKMNTPHPLGTWTNFQADFLHIRVRKKKNKKNPEHLCLWPKPCFMCAPHLVRRKSAPKIVPRGVRYLLVLKRYYMLLLWSSFHSTAFSTREGPYTVSIFQSH